MKSFLLTLFLSVCIAGVYAQNIQVGALNGGKPALTNDESVLAKVQEHFNRQMPAKGNPVSGMSIVVDTQDAAKMYLTGKQERATGSYVVRVALTAKDGKLFLAGGALTESCGGNCSICDFAAGGGCISCEGEGGCNHTISAKKGSARASL